MNSTAALAAGLEQLDLHAAVAQLLEPLGLDCADSGGAIEFSGQDPVVPSTARIASIGAIAIAARSAAAAAIWKDRTGQGQDIRVNLRQAVHAVSPFWQANVATLNGYPVTFEDPYNAFNFDYYRTRDGRFACLLNPTVSLRERALRFLQCRNIRRAVAAAVAQRDAAELEVAAQAAGVACAVVRTPQQWRCEPQGQYLADEPLISLTRIGDGPVVPLTGERPLSSVRALGLTHELAGPQIGAGLAEHGADALNIVVPGSAEPAPAYVMGNIGLRSAALNIDDPDGRARLHDLVRSADVLFHNRRASRIADLGLTPEEAAEVRPGIIHVGVSAFGAGGPWANWAGFDPHALSVTGFSVREGSEEQPRLPATHILNDFVSGWLGAVGALAALRRRSVEGGSWRVQISLARCSMWFMSLGLIPKEEVEPNLIAPEEPEWLAGQTPLGYLRTVASQVEMTATPPRFREPLLAPRGAALPEWLPGR